MAHRKAGGSTKNTRDSNAQYLGVKLSDGQTAKPGSILVRQRGNKFVAGNNVMQGKDHTLFAVADGIVKYKKKKKTRFTGSTKTISQINVEPKTPPSGASKNTKKTE